MQRTQLQLRMLKVTITILPSGLLVAHCCTRIMQSGGTCLLGHHFQSDCARAESALHCKYRK